MQELYAHALVVEREATKRFAELERYMRDAGMDHIADEFESIGKDELSPWEYAPHFLGPQASVVRAPKSVREALQLAIASERSAQNFYVDVAEHTNDDSMCAFAAEMAVDEGRHIARLERLLAREPDAAALAAAEGDVLPLKP
jgi:rubrerythrin